MKKGMIVIEETIENKIYCIRRKRVIFDRDLAHLYGVSTSNLNLAVKRNAKRFPLDFMFQLTFQEVRALILQFETSKKRGGVRKLPNVFTQEGVAMLSSVLRSERAIEVNIQIMRAFVRLRQVLETHKDLADKLESLERKCDGKFEKQDKEIQAIFEAIRQLMRPPEKPKRAIGFHTE